MVKIIAEIGVNHNGSVDLAKKAILAAKEAGADAVKFQTWITERLVKCGTQSAAYQVVATGDNDQFKLLKGLELSFESFYNLKEFCDGVGIEFLSTPDDFDSLYFLVDQLGMKTIKIGSGEIGNTLFVKEIGNLADQVILSTGMASLGDVENSLNMLDRQRTTVLHCTSNYPTNFEEVNLCAMNTLRSAFHVDVGYSDHTVGYEVAVAAVAMGASIIEKHFTLDKNLVGPDHSASCDPIEFAKLVDAVRNIEIAMGNGIKQPADSELTTRKVVAKRLFARNDLQPGQRLMLSDVDFLRSNYGLSVSEAEKYVGRLCLDFVSAGEALQAHHFEA